MRAASEFAARNDLPPRIQDQMLSHICLKFRTEGLKQQETLNDLPKALRSSIAQHLFFPIIQKVDIFRGVSYDFLFQLVKHHILFSFQVNNIPLVHFFTEVSSLSQEAKIIYCFH